jgi:hypothetical protein
MGCVAAEEAHRGVTIRPRFVGSSVRRFVGSLVVRAAAARLVAWLCATRGLRWALVGLSSLAVWQLGVRGCVGVAKRQMSYGANESGQSVGSAKTSTSRDIDFRVDGFVF